MGDRRRIAQRSILPSVAISLFLMIGIKVYDDRSWKDVLLSGLIFAPVSFAFVTGTWSDLLKVRLIWIEYLRERRRKAKNRQ
jgi:hypothetical protein